MNLSLHQVSLGLAIAALALSPTAALAKHGDDDGPGDDRGGQRVSARDDEKRVTGRCSGRSTAKLKVKPDDGRLEVEFEVDQNRNGVRWSVRLRRNGKVVSRARATTAAPSGSFSVERRLADPAGSDRITATATSPSGETCRASVTV
jgi:hypothetical protein